ncbi:hypothetical protein [Streptomyces sp. RerS4]|uniref:hypothetical protein n=1 Tax=Streptomyces sp. RerS4 TaxID=2942449 RepID=UPI00201C471F|nr:hypothetical protein [Streptomyces sp. RerS4]UQX02566.1 hypothetical protein M4D82_20255 [Streptomyces sp. RerS4]
MSAAGAAERAPVVSMRALLAAGLAATAVSTPPDVRPVVRPAAGPEAEAATAGAAYAEQAAPESEAA